VENFSIIKVSNAFKVILTHGNKNEVKIEASKKEAIERIITKVSKDKLIIKANKVIKGDVKVYVTYTNLEGIEQSGISELTTTNTIKGDKFYLDGSGASEMNLAIDVAELKLKFSGASEIKLKGSANVVALNLSGASELDAENLDTKHANIDLSGASLIKINVSERMEGKASGASSIHVKGAGVIDVNQSGASHISKG